MRASDQIGSLLISPGAIVAIDWLFSGTMRHDAPGGNADVEIDPALT
jgi:hypothetical protein